MSEQFAYLLGLILGRGYINYSQNRLIIEIAHKNKILEGIAHCNSCGGLATEKKENNLNKELFCKLCGKKVSPTRKHSYQQQVETINSLKNSIIPYLNTIPNLNFTIRGNDHMTFLIIDCSGNVSILNDIKKHFDKDTSYDSFHIPNEMHKNSRKIKIEFINGVLDTASFPAAGGWLNRPGKNGTGRMRSYFQIVRNWHLPVELCNFLKDIGLPIHTIDWGHPNIRDSNMEDYYNSSPTSWSREHQLKFFPEYYKEFSMRLTHKNALFKELIKHNENVGFDSTDDCEAPTNVGPASLKPFHFGENDPRIPTRVRCHMDAYWQVCHNLDCRYTHVKISHSKNKDTYLLTGKDEVVDIKKELLERSKKSKELQDKIVNAYKVKAAKTTVKTPSKAKTNPEEALYEPIRKLLEQELKRQGINIIACDTSSTYLDKFIMQNNLFSEFEFCNNYKIRPDIVGFDKDNKQLHFVEVKVGELTLKDIGQLLGYCLVAKPNTAVLVSPKQPSITLIKILAMNPGLLEYDKNKFICIGQWDGLKINSIYPKK